MNNCPKCGNPMQEGVTICPICGTNTLENNEAAPAAAPVPPAPAPAPAPVEAAPAPAAPAPASVEASAPVEPASVVETSAAPAAPAETPGAIAPTVERIEGPTPVPGIPSSVVQPTVVLNEEKPLVANPKLEGKKPSKKTPIIVAAILIVVLGIAGFMFLNPGKSTKKPINNVPGEEVAMRDMASNGYYLRVAEDWDITEDGNNVIVSNKEGTVVLKLDHSTANLENINAQGIENVLKSDSTYQDVEVSEIDMSGRNTFLVTANINALPVQVFFINGGKSLTLGATVVYQSQDSKTKYESTVTEMIGSLSYSADSVRAIETMSEYSKMFGVFNKVNYSIPANKPVEESKPEEPAPVETKPEEVEEPAPAEENGENEDTPVDNQAKSPEQNPGEDE